MVLFPSSNAFIPGGDVVRPARGPRGSMFLWKGIEYSDTTPLCLKCRPFSCEASFSFLRTYIYVPEDTVWGSKSLPYQPEVEKPLDRAQLYFLLGFDARGLSHRSQVSAPVNVLVSLIHQQLVPPPFTPPLIPGRNSGEARCKSG